MIVRNSGTPDVRDRASSSSQGGTRRALTGLEPYSGPWDVRHAAHLLRRCTFGFTRDDAAHVAGLSAADAVALLLSQQSDPPDPYGYGLVDRNDPQGPRRIYSWAEYTRANDVYYRAGVKAWWIGLMLKSGRSLRERMTLFWHNHFVSEFSTVLDSKYMHTQNQLFRRFAFGNVRTLTREVTADPAMLVYLNGNANTKGSPNENYARELQELFTIGKGPEIAAGNYTHYTEQDVREAARVLTGWRDNRLTGIGYFDATRHDTGDKTFSSAYQGTVIRGRSGAAGASELDELLDMIFRQDETARFLCRKLYRWFVYDEIDARVERDIIEPLAAQLRGSGYEIRPVLETLLSSAHFHADDTIGAMITDPLFFVLHTVTRFRFPIPEPGATEASQLTALNARAQLAQSAAALQMDLMDPPGVAGWPAYYQAPQFHELWINTATLPTRGGATDILVNGRNRQSVVIDAIRYAEEVSSDPSDPRVLIADMGADLFPIPLTQKQREYLLEFVLLGPGLPDYEWTVEWLEFKNDPTNLVKKEAVNGKLKALLRFLMRMAEYHLS